MPARQESCCFTGHRPAKLPWGYDESDPRCVELKGRIADAVLLAYQEGYRHFLCGMALGCDLYFCEAVLALREKYPEVTVEAAIPCPTQADAWPASPHLLRRDTAIIEHLFLVVKLKKLGVAFFIFLSYTDASKQLNLCLQGGV